MSGFLPQFLRITPEAEALQSRKKVRYEMTDSGEIRTLGDWLPRLARLNNAGMSESDLLKHFEKLLGEGKFKEVG